MKSRIIKEITIRKESDGYEKCERALEDDYSCADYADWNTGDRSSGSEPDAGYGGGIRERSPYKY